MISIDSKTPADKKLVISLLIFLFYLFLFFTSGFYSIRFTVGFLFMFFVPVLFLKSSKRLYYLSTTCFLIALFLLLFTPFVPWSYTVFVRDAEICSTVNELVSGLPDLEKVKKIMEWEKSNITGMYKKPNLILGIPSVWYRDKNPSWIFFYKHGNCEEFAILFVKMTKLAGMQSRRICNPAEDHNWAEVFIDNSWISIDPSNNRFINPKNYENERGIQMSYIYALENSQVIDITHRYTNVGKLILQVFCENRPVIGAKVAIKSRALMEKDPYYKSPREIVEKDEQIFLTDTNGIFVIELGGNDYSVTVEFDNYKVEKCITINENKNNFLVLYFS